MTDDKYWLCFWGLVAAVLISLILALVGYNAAKNAQIARMVKDGADPIAARCSMDSHPDSVCIAYVARVLAK